MNQDRFDDLKLFNYNVCKEPVTSGNTVKVFTDGRQKYIDLLEEMDRAKKFICIQYYIIRDDEIFDNVEEIASRKASQGVKVRIMTDGIGGRGLSKNTIKRLKKNNVEVAIFSPSLFWCVNPQFNHRNHKKIAVIDDVAYIGGFNLGDEYLGCDKRYGYWRDTHLKIKGEAVKRILDSFIKDWKIATGKNIDNLNGVRTYDYEKIKNSAGDYGGMDMQVIKSGYKDKVKSIHESYLRMIYSARRSLYIQTPYFVPDAEVLNALESASRSGVDIKLMVPGRADHPSVYWATGYYVGKAIKAGVSVYRYMMGFLHAKGMMVDGEICTFGTANTDIRSFSLNYEMNMIIYDGEFTKKMEEIFCHDLMQCEEISINRYENMGTISKMKCLICRGGARYM